MENAADGTPRSKTGTAFFHYWKWEILTLALIALVYLSGTTNRSFWAENDAYYALGAKSVLQGKVLLPVIYNDVFADKPPFMFWWVALVSVPFGGVTEFTARLANILGSLLVLGGMGWFARRQLFSTRAAVLSMIVLATAHEFHEVASEVNTDMLLVGFLFLSWSGLFILMQDGFTWRRWLLVWVAMSLGMLTKGPVAPLLSALVACTFAVWRFGVREGWRRLWSLRPVIGGILCIAPLTLWSLLVYRAHGFEPLETIFLRHNVQRFVAAFDHVKPWYYYFIQLPIAMLPWTFFAPVLIVHWWRRHRAGAAHAPWQMFAVTVIAVVFIFFSASSSKRGYYLLPLMPWLALLLGESMNRLAEAEAGERRRRVRTLVNGTAVFALLLIATYINVGYRLLDRRKSPERFVQQVSQLLEKDNPLIIFEDEDPRIMFYLDHDFQFFRNLPQDIEQMLEVLRTTPEVDILASKSELKLLKDTVSRPLFVKGIPHYRKDKFYVLTTEEKPGLQRLDTVFVRSQAVSRGKKKTKPQQL